MPKASGGGFGGGAPELKDFAPQSLLSYTFLFHRKVCFRTDGDIIDISDILAAFLKVSIVSKMSLFFFVSAVGKPDEKPSFLSLEKPLDRALRKAELLTFFHSFRRCEFIRQSDDEIGLVPGIALRILLLHCIQALQGGEKKVLGKEGCRDGCLDGNLDGRHCFSGGFLHRVQDEAEFECIVLNLAERLHLGWPAFLFQRFFPLILPVHDVEEGFFRESIIGESVVD